MQKNFYSIYTGSKQLFFFDKTAYPHALTPRKETLQRIMQFAAAYRAESLTEDSLSAILLN